MLFSGIPCRGRHCSVSKGMTWHHPARRLGTRSADASSSAPAPQRGALHWRRDGGVTQSPIGSACTSIELVRAERSGAPAAFDRR